MSDAGQDSRSRGLASRFGQVTFWGATFSPIAFAFDRQLAWLMAMFNIPFDAYPTGPFLMRQYEYLRDCGYLKNIFDYPPCRQIMAARLNYYDFELFIFLIWGIAILCLIRVLFELFDLSKLDRYAQKILERPISHFLAAFAFLGPGAMLMSADFEFAASSDVRGLMISSPRAFLALSTFLVGISTAFAAQGVLVLAWLILRRPWLIFRERKLQREAMGVGERDRS